MDLDSLKVFQTVAKEKSISKAAKVLNFVQSNVTVRIKQLESELQTQLFYRHHRGVTLTSAGKLLLTYTDKIIQLFEEARKAIQDSPTPNGLLTIGSMETTAAVRLPSILATYHKKFPQVEFVLRTGPTEELIQAVLDYEMDGAFVAGPVHHPDIAQEPIFREKLFLVSDQSQPISLQKMSDIKKRTILVFRQGCSYRARLQQWLYSEGILPIKIIEFGSVEAMIGGVMAGMGISLLPLSIVEKYQENGQLMIHPLPEAYSIVDTVFIRRHDVLMSNALQSFLNILSQETKEHYNGT